jgi:hypothetical protein
VPEEADRLEMWRTRMVAELAPRTEDGMSDGTRLIAGVEIPAVRAGLLDAASDT